MSIKIIISHMALMILINAQCQGAARNNEWFNKKLLEAAQDGSIYDVKILLEIKADPNTVDQGGRTALKKVAGLNSVCNQVEVANLLIQAKADINIPDKKKNTPLIAAIACGQIEIVKILLTHEAFLDETNVDGETALIVAAKKGHFIIARMLLNAGAHIDVTNKKGHTALSIAEKEGHLEIVALLDNYLRAIQNI